MTDKPKALTYNPEFIRDPDLSVGSLNDDDSEPPMVCPVTGSYCEGDLAYLCLDYGCARAVGESPRSEFEDDL